MHLVAAVCPSWAVTPMELWSHCWSQLAAISSCNKLSLSFCVHSMWLWCGEGEKFRHWEKIWAKRSLFGRALLVLKGEGSHKCNDCSGHNSSQSLGTAFSTEIKWPITMLWVSDMVLIQIRQPQSTLSGGGTVLLLMKNMSYLCVYCLLREKINTKTNTEELHAEVAFLHSFVGWRLTSLAIRVVNRSIMQPVCILWPQMWVVK